MGVAVVRAVGPPTPGVRAVGVVLVWRSSPPPDSWVMARLRTLASGDSVGVVPMVPMGTMVRMGVIQPSVCGLRSVGVVAVGEARWEAVVLAVGVVD